VKLSLGLVLGVWLSSFVVGGCTASSPEQEEVVVAGEEALTSLPASGTFLIRSKPSTGSYVNSLTLSANKKFEIEWVRRTTRMEPWVWNPFLLVPVTHEESMVLRGKWFTFGGDHGSTMVSLDVTDGSDPGDHFIFDLQVSGGGDTIKLGTTDNRTFELKKSSSSTTPAATDKRVIRCDGYKITATITLDEAQRRRGKIAIKRKPGADHLSPPEKTTTVVYTGDTGVDDYMGYEGRDDANNGYDFALKKSDLNKTSGPIANVGLGYSPDDFLAGGGAIHNSLTCTIATQ
jgi:hypothetical protein